MKILFRIEKSDYLMSGESEISSEHCTCSFEEIGSHRLWLPVGGCGYPENCPVVGAKKWKTYMSGFSYTFIHVMDEGKNKADYYLLYEGAVNAFGTQALMPVLPKNVFSISCICMESKILRKGDFRNFMELKKLHEEMLDRYEAVFLHEAKLDFASCKSLHEVVVQAKKILERGFTLPPKKEEYRDLPVQIGRPRRSRGRV